MASQRDLSLFTKQGYHAGRSLLWQAAWFALMNLVFVKWWLPPALRPRMLRAFGAQVGDHVFIRHGVRILWPWKLTVGAHSWIGEGVWLLNLEPITLGRHVCLSQEALLVTGSHNRHLADFPYDNAPIWIDDGAWIAARAVVLRGVRIGAGATVSAGRVVASDVPPDALVTQ